jgi:hypothetical protein
MSERRLRCLLTVFFIVVIASGSRGGMISRPEGEPSRQTESLITTYKTDPSLKWDVSPKDSEVVLKTRSLVAGLVNYRGTASTFANTHFLLHTPAAKRHSGCGNC